uniref:Probable polysaccharide biosynthesis protein n=1 Tax=Chlorobium chlorochromatii (strain CaD3) TaxID=340177 RepID=Q3AST7_CHLCH
MRYLKNTSWLFGEKVLKLFVGLFVGVWVAKYLGPKQFGLFSYAQSFVGLFSTIATLGLDGIVVRELVKDEKRRDELIGTAFWLKVIGAIAVLLVLAIAINFTSNDSYTNILVFIIASATVFQSFNVVDFFFQAKVMGKYITYTNTITLFTSSIVKITLILSNAPLIAFAWTVLFDSIVLALGFIYFYLQQTKYSKPHFTFRKEIAVSLLKDSWPLILSGFVISIYMKIDQVMIQEMIGSEAVGQYAAAVRISEAWYFIPMVVSSSLFPAIINAKNQSDDLYYARLQKLYNLMVWMAIAVALPMTFLSDWIVNLLYGELYNEAGDVLMIHIWAGLFVSLGVARGSWIMAENLQLFSTYFIGIAGAINVIGNYMFIPTYGINGAAFTTLVSYAISVIVAPYFFRATRHSVYMLMKAMLMFNLFRSLDE